jgi:hypothetical protein
MLAAIALGSLTPQALAWSDNPEIAKRQRAERRDFSDAEILEGFFRTRSAPNFIWQAASIASGNFPVRYASSHKGRTLIARRSLPESWPTSARVSPISTSPWPRVRMAPMSA